MVRTPTLTLTATSKWWGDDFTRCSSASRSTLRCFCFYHETLDHLPGLLVAMSGNSNILPIPFRRTHNLLFSDAIRSYISTKYDQHPDTFARDLEIIDQLRKDAVTSLEPHASGIRKLQAYAAQLVWMGGKFPVDVRICCLYVQTSEE